MNPTDALIAAADTDAPAVAATVEAAPDVDDVAAAARVIEVAAEAATGRREAHSGSSTGSSAGTSSGGGSRAVLLGMSLLSTHKVAPRSFHLLTRLAVERVRREAARLALRLAVRHRARHGRAPGRAGARGLVVVCGGDTLTRAGGRITGGITGNQQGAKIARTRRRGCDGGPAVGHGGVRHGGEHHGTGNHRKQGLEELHNGLES